MTIEGIFNLTLYAQIDSGIFLGLICDQISAPSQLKNEQKLPKSVHVIPIFFLVEIS